MKDQGSRFTTEVLGFKIIIVDELICGGLTDYEEKIIYLADDKDFIEHLNAEILHVVVYRLMGEKISKAIDKLPIHLICEGTRLEI